MTYSIRFQAILLAVMLAGPAMAQDGRTGFSFGGLAAVSSNPYIGDDGDVTFVPMIRYQGDGFSVGTDGVAVTVYDNGNSQLEAILTPRFSALDGADAPELAGIDRDLTVDAGLRYTLALGDRSDLRATLLQEVTGEHDGQELDVRITQSVDTGRVPLSLHAGATWRSDDLSAYMFGVRPNEATPGRSAYAPGATLSPYIGATATMPLGDSLALFGTVQAEYFGSAITNSPIVADRSAVSAAVGLQFAF